MASRVRDKLIEMANAGIRMVEISVQQLRAEGNAAGAEQQGKLKLKLSQERNQLKETNQGWQIAWGVVDRALAGMHYFCGTFHLPSLALQQRHNRDSGVSCR